MDPGGVLRRDEQGEAAVVRKEVGHSVCLRAGPFLKPWKGRTPQILRHN